MQKNIIQVQILVAEESKDLQCAVNNFLIERKISKECLIGFYYDRYSGKSIVIAYEVDMEEK